MGNSNTRRPSEEIQKKECYSKPKTNPVAYAPRSQSNYRPSAPSAQLLAGTETNPQYRTRQTEPLVQRHNEYTSLYPDISRVQQAACNSTASYLEQYSKPHIQQANASVQSPSLAQASNKPQKNVTETRIPEKTARRTLECQNARHGCKFLFDKIPIKNAHQKKCFFQDLMCPMTGPHYGGCTWTGPLAQLISHCDLVHAEERRARVNKPMTLANIIQDFRNIYLVDMDKNRFLVHVFVSEERRSIFMNVQFVGFKVQADKWYYEINVYNKSEPKRKVAYSDNIIPITKSVDDTFEESDCFVMPLPSAMTYINESRLTYKFYIKKRDYNNEASSQEVTTE